MVIIHSHNEHYSATRFTIIVSDPTDNEVWQIGEFLRSSNIVCTGYTIHDLSDIVSVGGADYWYEYTFKNESDKLMFLLKFSGS